ncbi:MAG TPA: DNA repair exonuclease [Burkholderiales bacterium]|nr:DNA repair exonuclease [Burkholderiales bacterium]
MIRPLRIAHTSDVHLGNGQEGAAARAAFLRVVDAVNATRAELFLIAGDLFDHNRIDRSVIDFVYEALMQVSCPTVIIAGNHDCWEERAVLKRMNFATAGEHVTLLDEVEGRTVEIPELHATVWGRCMVDHDRTNKPLAGTPGRTRDLWHVGMAHGLYSDEPDCERSSLITPDEIEASGFDYLALGHVHAHRRMRHGATLACYPGVPAPSYGTESHGSMALVELRPGEQLEITEHRL